MTSARIDSHYEKYLDTILFYFTIDNTYAKFHDHSINHSGFMQMFGEALEMFVFI